MAYGHLVRIAHISDCYLPRTGGIETQVRSLALRQVDSGDDVCVITATVDPRGVRSGHDILDGISVRRITVRTPGDLPIHPRTRRHVDEALRSWQPDVAHIHVGAISPFAWGAVRAAVDVGVPTVVTVHSVWAGVAQRGYAGAHAVSKWTRKGVVMSAVSDMAAERIRRSLHCDVLVIPNGIDPQPWRIEHVPAGPGVIRIASVMRFAPRKRALPLIHMLHEAHERLRKVGITLHATVIGDGPVRSKAQAYVRDHGLTENIALPGRMTHDAIRGIYGASDVYVQPSVKESFGIAAMEARCAGLPVIVRAETGSTQFISNRQEGLVVSDDEGMIAGIVELARNAQLRTRIANHNQITEPDQTWPRVLTNVREAYALAQASARVN